MTQFIQLTFVVLALRQDSHRVWGRFDHERPGLSTNQLLIAAAAIIVAAIVAVVWRLMKRRAARTFSSDNSTKLFRELCAAHGIKGSRRRLLKQLADARGVANPATLFVEPRYFQTQNLPPELKASARELRLLGEVLFG